MCIPSQIICDSNPKILDTLDVFQDHSLQNIWSTVLFEPFASYLHHTAFCRLKSHISFHCPASQLTYIFLKFQCVLCILNFSVTNRVTRKESYFRINVCWDIINEIAPMICLLFERSLATGQIPSDWTKAKVSPLFKKGDKGDPANYRPISLTCILCKFMEHIIA